MYWNLETLKQGIILNYFSNFSKKLKFLKNFEKRNQDFYKETSPLSYDVSASELNNRLSNDLIWHWPSVARYPLFSNGSIITNNKFLNLTNGYFWQINLTTYRDEYFPQIQPRIVLLNADDYGISVILQQTQKPSPPISGNITLRFNSSYIVSFYANSSSLNSYLTNIPGLDRNFFCDRVGYPQDNHKYLIRMSGLQAPVPLFELFGESIKGGQTKPTINISKIIQESNNTFYSPIPSEMLYTISKITKITNLICKHIYFF